MKILIESGATKADWCLIDGQGTEKLETAGMNVSTMDWNGIRQTISDTLGVIRSRRSEPSSIHLYTAGVPTEEASAMLRTAFGSVFPDTFLEIQTDLTASARAVCGHAPGIAAILGTGSNSCFYDGEKISGHINSGGYIIGDEGSAATLGKNFIADLIKGLVPKEIETEFAIDHETSYAGIVENVYRSTAPSAYLGSLARFLLPRYRHPYIKSLVDSNFKAFITRSLMQYDYRHYPVGIVGGFGKASEEIFTPLAESYGMRISCYIDKPAERLVEYHREQL